MMKAQKISDDLRMRKSGQEYNKKKYEKDLNVLSLFSGCGGMDLGFEGGFEVHRACINENIHAQWVQERTKKSQVRLQPTRFKTIFANDIRLGARKVWSNFFNQHYEVGSFHLESIVDRVKRHWDGEKNLFPNNVDVLTGGFPCQDFSLAGKRKGFSSHKSHKGSDLKHVNEDNRGMLYTWMREVIDIVQPKIFIAENVKGLISLHDVKEIIQEDFKNIGDGGYIVIDGKLLNSAEYGVPQSRERVFFIGFRKDSLRPQAMKELSKDIIPENYSPLPKKTHATGKINLQNLKTFVPLRTIFKDLKEPDQTSDINQKAYSRAKWYGKHCQGNREINLDTIGPTIRAEHHGNIEFRRLLSEHGGLCKNDLKMNLIERRLTIRECARIQTFPDNFSFLGDNGVSTSEAYKLIGNAVPPLLAYHIAKRIEFLWPKLFYRSRHS